MKWYNRGYFIAPIGTPIPKSIFLNSKLGLVALTTKVESLLDITTSVETYVKSTGLIHQLHETISKEDFSLANDLLKDIDLKVYQVRIEEYELEEDVNTLF